MVSVVIPTYNPGVLLSPLLDKIKEQTIPIELIIIDSESNCLTQQLFEEGKLSVVKIKRSEFNHGTTRNLGLKLANCETVIFMTQDALPASSDTLEKLVNMLYSRDDVAMAYGRQLPYPSADVFSQFARTTNYPEQSMIKNRDMIPKMGIKTCSCSNSFAAYRKKSIAAIGGFPTDTILGEDVSVAARFILQGDAVAYCAEAEVYHSHDYSIWEEFKRYFDIGVFHYEQRGVLSEFTRAESEGLKYVLHEWQYLTDNGHMLLIPAQIARTISKYVGYKLGIWENNLPVSLKRKISMHRAFWK